MDEIILIKWEGGGRERERRERPNKNIHVHTTFLIFSLILQNRPCKNVLVRKKRREEIEGKKAICSFLIDFNP